MMIGSVFEADPLGSSFRSIQNFCISELCGDFYTCLEELPEPRVLASWHKKAFSSCVFLQVLAPPENDAIVIVGRMCSLL
ncbi:unnamed protein product [Sphagnum tenellum]